MSVQDNSVKLGKENQNLVLETAGRIWVKVQDRFYELDFRNQNNRSTTNVTNVTQNISEETEEPDLSNYVTKKFLKATLNEYATKRNWRDLKETTTMLQNSLLDGFTEGISPITINTMQLVVGSEQLQYDFISSYNSTEGAISGGFVSENGEEILSTYYLKLKGGWIKHYTLDGPNTVRSQGSWEENNQTVNNSNELLTQYCRWHIADQEFHLEEGAYYVYIKVPKLSDLTGYYNGFPEKDRNSNNGNYYFNSTEKSSAATHTEAQALFVKTNAYGVPNPSNPNTSLYPAAQNISLSSTDGQYVISQSAIELDAEQGFYYLLFAIINSADDSGVRSYTTMNGFTEITPGRVTAYRFMSPDGIQYLNFLDKSMHLGDSNSYIHFDADEGKFYIKGTIVQSPAGDEFPLPCYRGVFTEEQIKATTNRPIFYYGDSITFEGSTWINTYKDEPISGVTPNETITVIIDNVETEIYPWTLYATKGDDPWFLTIDKQIGTVNVDNDGNYKDNTTTTLTAHFWFYHGSDKQEITTAYVSSDTLGSGSSSANQTSIHSDDNKITASISKSTDSNEENINTEGLLSITILTDAILNQQHTLTVRVTTGTGVSAKTRAFNYTLIGTKAGNAGWSTLTVMLYQRAQFGSTPPVINFPCLFSVKSGLERVQSGTNLDNIVRYETAVNKYNFSTYSTSAISGNPTGTWSRVIPNGNGTCYVTSVAIDTNEEQFIPASAWSSPESITPKNIAGKIMRGIKLWTAGTTYDGIQDIVLDSNGNDTKPFYDVVYYPDGPNRTFYYCVNGHTASNNDLNNNNTLKTDGNPPLWSPASQFDFIATNVLLAENAHINILSSTGMYVYDDSTPPKVIAGIQGLDGTDNPVNIFAGSNDVAGISNANFRVYGKTGRVIIKGSIEADGDNFEDEDDNTIEYAIKSNNGLLVSSGITRLQGTNHLQGTNRLSGPTNIGVRVAGSYNPSIDAYGIDGSTGIDVSIGEISIGTNTANNPSSYGKIIISPSNVYIVRGSLSSSDNVVSSPDFKRMLVVQSGASMSDADTIYFVKEVAQSNS